MAYPGRFRDPKELFARGGLIDELKKALSERMLAAELEDHLESEAEAGLGNRRNGTSKKTMLTGSSKLTLDTVLTMPKLAWPLWRPLRQGHGAENIRPLRKTGADIGTR
jgi:hypothetical protein